MFNNLPQTAEKAFADHLYVVRRVAQFHSMCTFVIAGVK